MHRIYIPNKSKPSYEKGVSTICTCCSTNYQKKNPFCVSSSQFTVFELNVIKHKSKIRSL